MLLHFVNDFEVVADVTIGHEADDTDVILFVRRIKRGADSFHHLGSARALTGREKILRLSQVFSRSWDWLRKQNACVSSEGDQVERVFRIETVERELHRLLRFFNRET